MVRVQKGIGYVSDIGMQDRGHATSVLTEATSYCGCNLYHNKWTEVAQQASSSGAQCWKCKKNLETSGAAASSSECPHHENIEGRISDFARLICS